MAVDNCSSFHLSACGPNPDDVVIPNPPNNPGTPANSFGTGWNSQENFSQTIPVAINYGNYQSGGSLPTSVDLTSQFPNRNQGHQSSCAAWAVGYNNKSYLDGVGRNL